MSNVFVSVSVCVAYYVNVPQMYTNNRSANIANQVSFFNSLPGNHYSFRKGQQRVEENKGNKPLILMFKTCALDITSLLKVICLHC